MTKSEPAKRRDGVGSGALLFQILAALLIAGAVLAWKLGSTSSALFFGASGLGFAAPAASLGKLAKLRRRGTAPTQRSEDAIGWSSSRLPSIGYLALAAVALLAGLTGFLWFGFDDNPFAFAVLTAIGAWGLVDSWRRWSRAAALTLTAKCLRTETHTAWIEVDWPQFVRAEGADHGNVLQIWMRDNPAPTPFPMNDFPIHPDDAAHVLNHIAQTPSARANMTPASLQQFMLER